MFCLCRLIILYFWWWRPPYIVARDSGFSEATWELFSGDETKTMAPFSKLQRRLLQRRRRKENLKKILHVLQARKILLLQVCFLNTLLFSSCFSIANDIPPIPTKYFNIIYEFCLARHNRDGWIAAVPESCSTAELVELNCEFAELNSIKGWIQTPCLICCRSQSARIYFSTARSAEGLTIETSAF